MNSPNPSKIIGGALELLEENKNWSRGAFARNLYGESVPPTSEHATCFCILGAVDRTARLNPANSSRNRSFDFINGAIEKHRGGRLPIPMFNDSVHTSHEDVLEVLMTAQFLALEAETADASTSP